jgi:SAM-dependent methyltransferase
MDPSERFRIEILMKRVRTEEILDSPDCPVEEVAASLRDIGRINRWFGGVTTTRKLIERAAAATGKRRFSMLEVGAGFGEVPRLAARQLARHGITLEITHLDCKHSHLLEGSRAVVANALALPFRDNAFDLVNCSLFAHHLEPDELARFASEALRVSRCALLINDLVRHSMHLALVYAGFPLMRSYASRNDGVASVRRAYMPEEMREMLSGSVSCPEQVEITQHYLYRMGVIVWKNLAALC